MHVQVYVFAYVLCIDVCMYRCVCVFTLCVYVCVCIDMCMCMYVCVCVLTCVCVCVCLLTCVCELTCACVCAGGDRAVPRDGNCCTGHHRPPAAGHAGAPCRQPCQQPV